MSQHPKFQFLTPHSKQWRVLRREESQRRRKIMGAYGEQLVPGKLPDPHLDRSLHNCTTLLTEREFKAFMKLKPKHVTKSLWLRGMVCEFLERRRCKTAPTMPFVVAFPDPPPAAPSAAKRRRARQ
ncbi:MAG: hypothetical protein WDN28_04580 [Chthoniobacter sp.]